MLSIKAKNLIISFNLLRLRYPAWVQWVHISIMSFLEYFEWMIIVEAECLQSANWITSHIPALPPDPVITTTVLRLAAGGRDPHRDTVNTRGRHALSAPLIVRYWDSEILRYWDKAQSLIQQSDGRYSTALNLRCSGNIRHRQRLWYNEEEKIRANIPPISHPSLSLLCVTYDVSVNTNHVALNLNTWLPQVRITGDTNTLTTVIIRPPAQTNIITHSDKMVIQIRDGGWWTDGFQ